MALDKTFTMYTFMAMCFTHIYNAHIFTMSTFMALVNTYLQCTHIYNVHFYDF